LVRKIASGGMATVYEAAVAGEQRDAARVAIKVLHPHLSEDRDFVRMFHDEARLSMALQHPHITRVFEAGEADGQHFLVMEFVDGTDLARLMQRYREAGQRLSLDAVVELMDQLLAALGYLHAFRDERGRALKLVHRDVSPQNVLVSANARVKLADFGIARGGHRSERTVAGIIKGKVAYMSPEQAQGRSVDRRSDLYALGVMCYELLTAQPLHRPNVTEALRHEVASGELRFGRRFERLPIEVQNFLRCALEPEANRRFQSAEEMRAALDGVARKCGHRDSNALRAAVEHAPQPVEKKPPQPQLFDAADRDERPSADKAPGPAPKPGLRLVRPKDDAAIPSPARSDSSAAEPRRAPKRRELELPSSFDGDAIALASALAAATSSQPVVKVLSPAPKKEPRTPRARVSESQRLPPHALASVLTWLSLGVLVLGVVLEVYAVDVTFPEFSIPAEAVASQPTAPSEVPTQPALPPRQPG